jgi:hypothetical protein
MDFRLLTVNGRDGSTNLYFKGISHWDDFDLLLGLLQQENECEIINNFGAVYLRKAELKFGDINFALVQDDFLGNFLYTINSKDVPILEHLANNVIRSIQEKLKRIRK